MVERHLSDDLIRDLVQCVQAARDGADASSLFAMQCELVLRRVSREAPGLLQRRAVEHTASLGWEGTGTYALHRVLES